LGQKHKIGSKVNAFGFSGVGITEPSAAKSPPRLKGSNALAMEFAGGVKFNRLFTPP
jgi:hypothetical protein